MDRMPWHGLRSRWLQNHSELASCVREGRAEIGSQSYGFPRVLTYGHDATRLIIGSYVSMAEGVTFVLGGNHRMDSASSFPLRLRLELAGRGNDGNPWSKGNIVIGSDVWLGVGALVLSGVTIGHGAVVAAGAVVVKDVPPYSLVAGNPARIVRMRFEEKTVKSLLRIAWWNWPQQKITREVAALCDMPAEQFAALFDPLGQDCSQ